LASFLYVVSRRLCQLCGLLTAIWRELWS